MIQVQLNPMIPGSTSITPPEFPNAWLGLWKDQLGRVLFLDRIGPRMIEVSGFQGVRLPAFPLIDGGVSVNMPGVYEIHPFSGPFLRVTVGSSDGPAGFGLQFQAPEGNRLRFAEAWDMVNLITMVPMEISCSERLEWLQPLGPFRKANEEWDAFVDAHPGWGR